MQYGNTSSAGSYRLARLTTLDEDMHAYDSLPKWTRELLANSQRNYSAVEAKEQYIHMCRMGFDEPYIRDTFTRQLRK